MNPSNRQVHANRRPASNGFSILELLIALGLLGTLLALAWSILGSYRTAQQRGWDQTYRLRLAAAARDLLEQDALHFASHIPMANQQAAGDPFTSEMDAAQLRGDTAGFTIITVASIDPLPWLEEVLGGGENQPQVGIADLYRLTDSQTPSAANNPLRRFPEPLPQPVQLRYSIQTITTENPDSGDSNTANTVLIRAIAPLSGSSQSDQDSDTAESNRVLGTDDLYRQTDPETEVNSAEVITNSLRGLTDAAFRYSDGNEWRNSWNSVWDEGLPRAIELSFDYVTTNSTENAPSTIDRDSDAQPVNGEIQRDVRIVVLITAGQTASTTSSASTQFISGGTGR